MSNWTNCKVQIKLNKKKTFVCENRPDWRNKIVKLENGSPLGVAIHMLFSN